MRAFPFLRPSPDVVTPGEWNLSVDDQDITVPDRLPDWDYNVDLVLRRSVVVDVEGALRQSGLPAGTDLALAVTWRASGSRLSGCAARHVLRGDTSDYDLDIRLRGADLGGVLTLSTTLTLARRPEVSQPLAPRRAGTLLWSEDVVIRLQGDGSQFPMAVVEFERTQYPDRAGWHLQITGSLESAAMGSLLLLINANHDAVFGAFRAAAKPSPQQRAVVATVRSDVVRTLVEWALSKDDFDANVEYPEFSLGSATADLFRFVFGEAGVDEIRQRRDRDPSYFSTDLQARLELFWDI